MGEAGISLGVAFKIESSFILPYMSTRHTTSIQAQKEEANVLDCRIATYH
jgi:hypothetical protein